MKLALFKNLDKDEEEIIKDEYISSLKYREQVQKVLNEFKMSELEAMTSKKIFDTPSWSHKQASSLGYIRAIDDLLSLIK